MTDNFKLILDQQDFIDELIADRERMKKLIESWKNVANDSQDICKRAFEQRDKYKALYEELANAAAEVVLTNMDTKRKH